MIRPNGAAALARALRTAADHMPAPTARGELSADDLRTIAEIMQREEPRRAVAQLRAEVWREASIGAGIFGALERLFWVVTGVFALRAADGGGWWFLAPMGFAFLMVWVQGRIRDAAE